MAYEKRISGRAFDEARPIEAKAGVIKKADGSAYFKIGETAAYAAVYGPRECHPAFMRNPKKGILRCHYTMMPFSGDGERVRPGPNRRAKEISMVTENSLKPVLDLENYPNTVVDVFIELPETDAGSRCAGICAASIALADAGITMKDMVPSVSVGQVEGQILVDLDGAEEHMDENAAADVPMAMIMSTGEITLLQMDGIVEPEKLIKAMDMVEPAMMKIAEIQRQAIKDRYKQDLVALKAANEKKAAEKVEVKTEAQAEPAPQEAEKPSEPVSEELNNEVVGSDESEKTKEADVQ